MSDGAEYYKGVIGIMDMGVKIVEVPTPSTKPNRAQRRAMKKGKS